MEEVGEMLVINTSGNLSDCGKEKCHWDPSSSKRFIDLYSQYRDKVGTNKIKTMKQLWVIIAEELSKEYNMEITPSNAENRWRVLERSYRKYVVNKHITGRKYYYKYAEEMDKILGHLVIPKRKKNLISKCLLDSQDIRMPKEDPPMDVSNEETIQYSIKRVPKETCQNTKKEIVKHKNNLMDERMKVGWFDYQKEKLKLLEKLGNDRNNLIKERNEILKEKNEILKNSCS